MMKNTRRLLPRATHALFCLLSCADLSMGSVIEARNSQNELLSGEGVIQSPGYPDNYPAFTGPCVWKLEAPENYVFKISFEVFDIPENTRSAFSVSDLEVHGDAFFEDPLRSHEQGSLPDSFTTKSNKVIVQFSHHSGHRGTGKFSIKYEQIPTPEAASCDQRILSTSSGVVTLPNYPEFFQGYAICDFVIETSPGSTVRLTVQDIDIDNESHVTLFEPSYGLFQFMYHPLETVPDVGAVFQSVDNIVTIRYGATNVLNAKNKFKFGYEIVPAARANSLEINTVQLHKNLAQLVEGLEEAKSKTDYKLLMSKIERVYKKI